MLSRNHSKTAGSQFMRLSHRFLLSYHQLIISYKMQDPRRELPNVISNLTSTSSPSVQRATVLRFFTPDASFAHPLCRVSPGSGSRERILGVYQWYRVLSPVVKSEVVELSWDKHPVGHPMDGVHGAEIVGDGSATDMTSTDGEGMTVYVQVVQWFNLRISPFAAAPSRLTVRLTLHKEGELYYIAAQEDLFHPAVSFQSYVYRCGR